MVEDEDRLRRLLEEALAQEGHVVSSAKDGDEASYMVKEFSFDAVVLDWMLPGRSGIEVCREMRDADDWTPVIMLTAKDALQDRVQGLDCGADDYLVKPFSFVELGARLRAVSRRTPTSRSGKLVAGDISLDPATRRVTIGERPIDLTPKEFALLEHLLRHKGEAVSRMSLIENVWDFAYDGNSNVVDVYIGYLRKKLRDEGDRLQTIRGVGYRLAE